MSKNEADILELEKELAVVETGALEEEKYNAEVNYGYLANEMMTCKNSMPYPDVGRYDVGIDYEERAALHYKKGANKPFTTKLHCWMPIITTIMAVYIVVMSLLQEKTIILWIPEHWSQSN